jgi:hypothetical protein
MHPAVGACAHPCCRPMSVKRPPVARTAYPLSSKFMADVVAHRAKGEDNFIYPFRYASPDSHIHEIARLDRLPHPVGIIHDRLGTNHVERYHSLFTAEMLPRLLAERKQLHKPGETYALEIPDPVTGKAVPLSGIDAIEWPSCD